MSEMEYQQTDCIVAAVLALLCITALTVYSLFFGAVLHTPSLRRNPFFRIACMLAATDCIALLTTLFYAVPSLVLGQGVDSTIPGVIVSLSWFSSSPLITLLSINRYVIICRSHLVDHFSLSRTKYSLMFVALVSISASVPSAFKECGVLFSVEMFGWGYNVDLFGAVVLSWFDLAYTVLFVGTSVVINVLVFKFIVDKRNQVSDTLHGQTHEARRRHRERKIFPPLFIVTSYFLLFTLLYDVVPIFYYDKWVGLVTSLAYILNCSINGFVYVTLNDTVKSSIKVLVTAGMVKLGWKKLPNPTITGSASQQAVQQTGQL